VVAQLERWKTETTPAVTAFEQARLHPLLAPFLLPPDGSNGWAAVGRVRLPEKLTPPLHQRLRGLEAAGLTPASWPLLKFDVDPLMRRDLQFIFLPMLLALFVALFLALRNWRDFCVAAFVLALGLGLVFAVIGGRLQHWHFLNIIGLVLLMGAGIDYTLHMIFALRRVDGDSQAVMRSTGMAVFFCSVTTALGFGSLAMASTPALADLGLVVAFGILTLASLSMWVLPGLWQWLQRPRGIPNDA
jgi:hypothetical protein